MTGYVEFYFFAEKSMEDGMNYADRVIIEQFLRQGRNVREIANELHLSRQAIYAEIKRSGQSIENYKAVVAQFHANNR